MLLSHFNPVAFHLGPVAIHWYGLAYAVTFLAFLTGGKKQLLALPKDRRPCTPQQFESLSCWLMMGVLLGGRIGYQLFYNTFGWVHDPLQVLLIWQGGMSFHGGAVGCILALWWFAKKEGLSVLALSDQWVVWVPFGIGLGRLANFINGELWGRPTQVPWGMVFPWVDNQARHPSQLYEMMIEGVLLGVILLWLKRRPRPRGWFSGFFLLGYGVARFFVEYFRAPDMQLGLIAWHHWTMGQCLSVPMVLWGFYLLYKGSYQGEVKREG